MVIQIEDLSSRNPPLGGRKRDSRGGIPQKGAPMVNRKNRVRSKSSCLIASPK